MQQHFELIPHLVEAEIVQQRVKDGYINATAMCQATGKKWNHYASNDSTKAFISALAADTGIPATVLVQSLSGGRPELQGTWVHPQVAINLATWCSATFAVQVSKWVYEWMSGKSKPGNSNLPYHLQRYLVNSERVPAGYFSVLAELSIMLIAPLERMGYRLPPELVPDISSGRIYCKELRAKGVDTDALPTYWHTYEDGRRVPAKLYPEIHLADFRRHVREVWIPKYATEYFRKRDASALQYLPKLIAGPKAA
ncbi:KilA-N domain-containing protein [Methylobacterium sp. WL8]|uniref:KilA-N domain-containing protein n=1 Tax=Methylobacterium sp. WL8 TaxID=2603899 RepID=UPI0011C717E5|nr:KilA-N domain-containing protein [Methylobacterium sp. WL8]TXN79289.1 KilA-N domain-containing protein [Methylobacterium sp. WL8]